MGAGGRGKGRRGGDDPREVRISKALTQILRHKAEELGLPMRPDGYVRLQQVLKCKAVAKFNTTAEDVEKVSRDSDKRRFEITEDDGIQFIRAVQGHSIKSVQDAELMKPLSADDPDLPGQCVHGTYKRHVQAILKNGLLAGGKFGNTFRNHVHFAPYAPGDGRVVSGMRYDSDVAVWINLRQALRKGVPFFMAKNEVILSPGIDGVVPAEFIERVCNIKTGEVLSGGPPSADEALMGAAGGGDDAAAAPDAEATVADEAAHAEEATANDADDSEGVPMLRWFGQMWESMPWFTQPGPVSHQ